MPVYAQSVLSCSHASSARYAANVAAYGTSPVDAMPAAIDTMFCSATPTLKNRSGCRAAKSTVRLAPARSAVSTTIRGSESARSARASPATNAGMLLAVIPLPVRSSFSVALPRKTSLVSWRSAIGAARDERLQAALDLGDHVAVVLAYEVADVPL